MGRWMGWVLVMVSLLVVAVAWGAGDGNPDDSKAASPKLSAVSVEVARDRAELAHQIYTVTLDVIHEHYFHPSKAVLPARAMEDVFTEVARQTKVEGRWIAVNTKAMSVHHEPRTDFEKRAAKELAGGKEAVEVVEEGFYRRATPIPFTPGCISCHAGLFAPQTKTPRFAGLVVSVPVSEEKK